SLTGLPNHVTASFNPTTVTPTAASPVKTTVMTLTSDANAAAGTTTLTVKGTSGTLIQNAVVSPTVTVSTSAAYRVTVSPTSQEINATSSAAYTVAVSRFNGFTGAITLATDNTLASGATSSFSPNPIPSGSTSSTLTVSTTRTTALGTNTFKIKT